MQQGKHTEYEKNLHEELLAATAAAEIAESAGGLQDAAVVANGTLGGTSNKLPPDAKTSSRTPSPKVGSSGGGGGWPNLSSASSTPTNSASSGSGGGKGSSNINNNFRSDLPER
jgi:hypothetical protein